MGKKYHTIQDLKSYALNKKGECLSERYINSSSRYDWKCKKGHIWQANWNNVLSKNNWCKRCAAKDSASKYGIQDLIDHARAKGGVCLSKIYTTDKDKYTWRCNKHNYTWETTWNSIVSRGSWCSKCKAEKTSKTHTKYSIETLYNLARQEGGECLSNTYRGLVAGYKFRCKMGHIWETKGRNILYSKSWCPKCDRLKLRSKAEISLAEFCKTLGKIKESNRSVLNGKEIDILFLEEKIGIEYHGLFWHSEATMGHAAAEVHLSKYLLAKKQGIKLIQIFEDEWLEKPEIVKSIIRNAFKKNLNKYNARDCVLKEVGKEDRAEFFKNNHINGDVRSIYCLGLYYKEELVCAVSIRHPFTRRHKGSLEIARFATKLNSVVRGGFSKLLKGLKDWMKAKGCTNLISYADLRFGEGEVYAKCGFNFLYKTTPNYFYGKSGKRENRFKHRKNNDPDFIAKFGDTEKAQNNNQGWYAIYDVGSNLYSLAL